MRQALFGVRCDYQISLHCVGLSLGSIQFDTAHAARIRRLVDDIDPALVSDHLSVSTLDGVYSNDLLPLPYTQDALDLMVQHVDQAQTVLGRQMLIENPSRALSWAHSTIPEHEFLAQLAQRTGCGLLCDVNNIFVSAMNQGADPLASLLSFPARYVREIHLAGHDTVELEGYPIRIDTHDRPVCADVWTLFEHACDLFGDQPVLVEWDSELPELPILLDEARRAAHTKSRLTHEVAHAAAS